MTQEHEEEAEDYFVLWAEDGLATSVDEQVLRCRAVPALEDSYEVIDGVVVDRVRA